MTTPFKTTTAVRCVLLFSGGRDSTLAALELASKYELVLLTLTGEHLVDFTSVIRRTRELQRLLPPNTEWFLTDQVRQTADPSLRGCMSCQLTATTAAIQLAKRIGATAVATGFAGYQRNWIEQSPEAIDILRRTLADVGLHLELPSASLGSKQEAMTKLAMHGLNVDALEQKCIEQQLNPQLTDSERALALRSWATNLARSIIQPAALRFRGPYALDGSGVFDD